MGILGDPPHHARRRHGPDARPDVRLPRRRQPGRPHPRLGPAPAARRAGRDARLPRGLGGEVPARRRAHRLEGRLPPRRAVVPEARRRDGRGLERAPVPRGDRVLRGLRRLRRGAHAPEAANKGHVGGTGVLKEETELAGGLVRAHFVAEDVHDFAFAACPRFEVVRDTFSAKGLPNVDIVLLLQPDHRPLRDRYLKATKVGLEDFGTRYLPTPTRSSRSWTRRGGATRRAWSTRRSSSAAGAELAPKKAHSPESVTVHEYGHQVFYGMLASNEVEEAHLDEGFNTYATMKALKAAFGDPSLVVRFYGLPVTFAGVTVPYPFGVTDRFHRWQIASRSDAQAVPSYRQMNGERGPEQRLPADGAPPRVVRADVRRGRLGEGHEDVRDALRLPASDDGGLRRRRERGRGRGRRAAAFAGIVGTAGSVDYAVTSVETHAASGPTGYAGEGSERKFEVAKKGGTGTYESTVVVQRFGEAAWPVDVVFTFADGSTLTRGMVRSRALGALEAARAEARLGRGRPGAQVPPRRQHAEQRPSHRAGPARLARVDGALHVLGAEPPRGLLPARGRGGSVRRDSVLVLASRGVFSALETWKALLLALVFNLLLAYAFAHPVNAALRQALDRSPWGARLVGGARAALRALRRDLPRAPRRPRRPLGVGRDRDGRRGRARRHAPRAAVRLSSRRPASRAPPPASPSSSAALAAFLAGGFAGRFGGGKERGSFAAFGADAARFALPSLLLGALSLAGIAAAYRFVYVAPGRLYERGGPAVRVGGDPPRPPPARRLPRRRRGRPPRRPLHARRDGTRGPSEPRGRARDVARVPRAAARPGLALEILFGALGLLPLLLWGLLGPVWDGKDLAGLALDRPRPAGRRLPPHPRPHGAPRRRVGLPRARLGGREPRPAAPTVASESEPARRAKARRRPRRDRDRACARGRPSPGPIASSRRRTSRRSSRTTPSASFRPPSTRSRSSGRTRSVPGLADALSALAAEELRHFRKASREAKRLGAPLPTKRRNWYVAGLRAACRERRRARARPRPPPRRRAHRGAQPRALRAPPGRA